MSLVVTVLLVAVVVGRLSGGSLGGLGRLPLRAPALVGAALAAQLVGAVVGGPLHLAGLVLSSGLALAFLLVNRALAGTPVVALGLLSNVVVIGANGAMPVSLEAAERAGAPVEHLLAGTDPRHELQGGATRLSALGDVIPVRHPVRPEVVSVGDVLLAAGLGQLVVVAMRSANRPAPAGGRPAAPSRRRGRPRRALPPLSGSVPRP